MPAAHSLGWALRRAPDRPPANGAGDGAGVLSRGKLRAVLLLEQVGTVQGAQIPGLRTVRSGRETPVLSCPCS